MNLLTLKSTFLIATTLCLIGCSTQAPDYSRKESQLYQFNTKDIHRDLYQKTDPTPYDLLTKDYPTLKSEAVKETKKYTILSF